MNPEASQPPGRPERSDVVEALFAGSALDGRVRVFELWGRGDEAAIAVEEAAVVADAVDGRRSEFAAGRQCAHGAIALFDGIDSVAAILPDGKRAPQWPAGVVGSISHTEGYAVAALAADERNGHGRPTSPPTLGIDAERVGRVTGDLFSRLFLPAEQSHLTALDSDERDAAATLMFGAKEAFYKAQYPVTSEWVGFHDVELRPDPADPLRFALHPATRLAALDRFAWPLTARGSIRSGIAVTAVVAVGVTART